MIVRNVTRRNRCTRRDVVILEPRCRIEHVLRAVFAHVPLSPLGKRVDEIVITVPELKKFKFQGAGSSKINNLNADDFELSYEGAGSLTANGKIKHLVIRSQGVGSIDMKDVTANDVEVKGEGVGSISVTAIDKLSASLQGIGSLTYYGHPKTVSKAVQGIGSIKAGD